MVTPVCLVTVQYHDSTSMSIFDTLAENRYQQWLEDSACPDYQPPEPVPRTTSRTSFEGQLLQQILTLLEKAAAAPEQNAQTSRSALLAQADALAFQLQISLEKKNMPLVAATLATSIRHKRSELA